MGCPKRGFRAPALARPRSAHSVSHICYSCRIVSEVASRDLRNNTRGLLERVEGGEEITITVDGRPVAVLRPVGRRPVWVRREEFTGRILQQADAGLTADLAVLTPDTTDDLPFD